MKKQHIPVVSDLIEEYNIPVVYLPISKWHIPMISLLIIQGLAVAVVVLIYG